ncbi:uncharacterized protein LOC129755567 [Uranotaenia lowii]|uniref:uncharacterized protein LOC129750684 n=1 Tax=Uranotaenia lowii TaxID=190385 RepID=UPI00247A8DD8|nr:uncharacterized protein LOC129750684 [Uranotaenia lowii]XP_055608098.1 uncharacterized protein LOC129755567 [Uranotaenia lowii]
MHRRFSFGANSTFKILVAPLKEIGMSAHPSISRSSPEAVFKLIEVPNLRLRRALLFCSLPWCSGTGLGICDYHPIVLTFPGKCGPYPDFSSSRNLRSCLVRD